MVALGTGAEIGVEAFARAPSLAAKTVAKPITEETPSLRDEIETVERSVIARTLAAVRGNQSEAARRLGLARGTLMDRLRKYGLEKATANAAGGRPR